LILALDLAIALIDSNEMSARENPLNCVPDSCRLNNGILDYQYILSVN